MYILREMCSLSSQLMLNLNTEDIGVYHNGEVECLGLCHLAKLHAQQVKIIIIQSQMHLLIACSEKA